MKRKPTRKRGGFTLMEVLLVLMILVVLASMAVTIFGGTQEQALKDAAKGQIGVFKTAISTYQIHTRKLPTDIKELVEKPADSKVADRWNGPYLDRDPDSYDVWSTGPDGQDGTADDIGNWE